MRSRRKLVYRLYAPVVIGLTGAVLALWAADLLREIDLRTVDARFSIRGEHEAKDVVVVGIDARAFEVVKTRYPFNRRRDAEVIDQLRRARAKVIVYDVQFTEPTGNDLASKRTDSVLLTAAERAPRIVFSTSEVGKGGTTGVFGGDDKLKEIGARAGAGIFPNDPGPIIRRMIYDDRGLLALPVVAAELATGRKVSRGRFQADGTAWIDFPGPPRTVRTVSYGDVLEGRVDPALLRDKIVVVGATAPTLKDVFPTSTASKEAMSGPEIHAAAIQTILDGFPLRHLPSWLEAVLIVFLGLLAAPLTLRLGPLRAGLVGLAVAALYLVGAQVAFNGGLIVPVLYPLLALGLGIVGATAVAAALGTFERERVRDVFARFVPEAVVDEVLARADQDLRLGGERKIATVLFSDVRGFTMYAENQAPEQVIEVLNHYLTAMSDVILEHGGTLIAYMGDGIMAAFGAPTEQPDHADRALAAAEEMAGPALESVNAWLRERGGEGFAIGIGLNSGPVMAGNVGSQRRLEYTTIGDTTNTASRLESMTKGSGHTIFLSDSVRQMLARPRDDLIHVERMQIRGRDEPVTVWSLSA